MILPKNYCLKMFLHMIYKKIVLKLKKNKISALKRKLGPNKKIKSYLSYMHSTKINGLS